MDGYRERGPRKQRPVCRISSRQCGQKGGMGVLTVYNIRRCRNDPRVFQYTPLMDKVHAVHVAMTLSPNGAVYHARFAIGIDIHFVFFEKNRRVNEYEGNSVQCCRKECYTVLDTEYGYRSCEFMVSGLTYTPIPGNEHRYGYTGSGQTLGE
jgi:hypothetical protein